MGPPFGARLEVTSWPLSSAAYIKAYLLENGVCIAKKKTKVARKSLDPLYNQVLLFPESPQGKVLQVRGPGAGVCVQFSTGVGGEGCQLEGVEHCGWSECRSTAWSRFLSEPQLLPL